MVGHLIWWHMLSCRFDVMSCLVTEYEECNFVFLCGCQEKRVDRKYEMLVAILMYLFKFYHIPPSVYQSLSS
jgi:hypothetical protein